MADRTCPTGPGRERRPRSPRAGRERRSRTDRGQSETLGFVLVFGLILGTMALVTTAGVAELGDVRDAQRLHNAEHAFETLDANVADLLEGRPSQATEISLDGARVSLGDEVTWQINGTAVGNASRNFSFDVSLRPVVYATDADSARLVYASGAVFRQQRDGTAVLDRPESVLSPEGSALVVVQTRGSGRIATGGSTSALVRTVRPVTDLYRLERQPFDLTITVDSSRAPAWARVLGRHAGTTCTTPSATRTTCRLRTDRLSVAVGRVDVTIE